MFLFFFSLNNISAQAQYIQPYKAKEINKVNAFNDLAITKNIAAIEDRDIIFYVENNRLWLAKLITSGWLQILLSEKYNSDKELKIEEFDIDEKGSKELIIYWDYLGKIENVNVMLKGIQIWNIDEQVCYLDEFTTAFEERYMKTTESHYYAGCERKIKLENGLLNISAFDCDIDLSFDILPEISLAGKFKFLNGRFEQVKQ